MARASRHVQPYLPEFREEAIRLARSSGKSHRQIAADLGVTSETLRLWLKQAVPYLLPTLPFYSFAATCPQAKYEEQ